jgi:hypothetical protein
VASAGWRTWTSERAQPGLPIGFNPSTVITLFWGIFAKKESDGSNSIHTDKPEEVTAIHLWVRLVDLGSSRSGSGQIELQTCCGDTLVYYIWFRTRDTNPNASVSHAFTKTASVAGSSPQEICTRENRTAQLALPTAFAQV